MDDQAIPYNRKIDQIGLVGELKDLYTDGLRDDVKADMSKKGANRAEGDLFDAMLVTAESRSVDTDGLLKLYEKKQITRDQFLSAIKANVSPLGKFLSENDIEKISTKTSSVSLRVARKKGVALVLLDCVRGISEAVMGKKVKKAA
jgi:predicted nucleotide-binding protein (sugar kinase/HSP70/actin superfamily)